MKELTIPPAAQRDDDSWELLRAWVAEEGLHCSLKVGVMKGKAFGKRKLGAPYSQTPHATLQTRSRHLA